ncbi:hypothetical protein HMI56_005401 [Coelomomyces lativittatus]|nr:hypothetical protein HMI56_005401 [Coelomomyces lativittatus]
MLSSSSSSVSMVFWSSLQDLMLHYQTTPHHDSSSSSSSFLSLFHAFFSHLSSIPPNHAPVTHHLHLLHPSHTPPSTWTLRTPSLGFEQLHPTLVTLLSTWIHRRRSYVLLSQQEDDDPLQFQTYLETFLHGLLHASHLNAASHEEEKIEY